jgi:hypothetical protein
MIRKFCPREKEIIKRIKSRDADEEIYRHVKTCSVCRESLLVLTWMRRFQKASESQLLEKKILPSPEILESKWTLRIRKANRAKALRPLIVPRILIVFTLALVVIFVVLPGFGKLKGVTLSDSGGEVLGSLLKGVQFFMVTNPLVILLLIVSFFFLIISELKNLVRFKSLR